MSDGKGEEIIQDNLEISSELTSKEEQEGENMITNVEEGLEPQPEATTTAGEDLDQPKKEEVEVAEGQELEVLPENEEEKEEMLLMTSAKKSKTPPPLSKTKHYKRNRQKKKGKEMTLTDLSKQLEEQTVQINKIRQMLQPIQKQIKSTKKQLDLIQQLQSQIKQLQKQVSQIHKSSITKKKR